MRFIIEDIQLSTSLQTHPAGIMVCDEEAASEIKVSTYRYFKEIEKDNLL